MSFRSIRLWFGIGRCRVAIAASAVAIALLGCQVSYYDGLYRVDSHSIDSTSCAGPGQESDVGFSTFEIVSSGFVGITFYSVYPCDDSGVCYTEDAPVWDTATTEGDLDNVSYTVAFSQGDACVLEASEHLIEGTDDGVVIERRIFQIIEAPYDAATCTTGRAEARRHDMECVSLERLIGVLEPPAQE